jgi:diacylglycerol kinase (CTP)
MAAKGGIRTRSQKGDASKVNGHAGGEADQEMRQTFGMRARSASLQKGVAVLRALARAPEGEGTSEVDSGYEDEVGEANVGAVPGKRNGKAVEGEEADVKLTKEAIESGRINREGLRKRNEQKEVEKLIGSRSQSSSESDSSTVKRKEKRKSVLITEKPRKIFHGSIGEYLQ